MNRRVRHLILNVIVFTTIVAAFCPMKAIARLSLDLPREITLRNVGQPEGRSMAEILTGIFDTNGSAIIDDDDRSKPGCTCCKACQFYLEGYALRDPIPNPFESATLPDPPDGIDDSMMTRLERPPRLSQLLA